MEQLVAYVPILHIVTAVLAVIELGLTAYLVTPYNGWADPPSAKSFMLFNAIFSLLVLAYLALTPKYFPRFFHRLVALGLEAVTSLFWFAGSIALAAGWAHPRCGGNNYCGSVNAAVAFGFFLWALFTFFAILSAREVLRSRSHPTTAPAAKPYVAA
ncbi:membrane-associating domain-containing protein [Cercophora newfieldiana]|uniref:Membrane-associating domain-containing protein n=1 Tax=Cercophora newfieldiana TaxID=92897 RepID=A0AA40CRM6_9PEZI|nr:membrane-associating domain-containing protein [Cercophora newfieldiana]